MTIDYETLKNEIVNLMVEHPTMALATSAVDRTTCRMISVVTNGLEVFFQTSVDSLKCEQIAPNPNAALCFGNVTLEGTAEIVGRPVDLPDFLARYQSRHNASYERYSFLKEERVVRIHPRIVALCKYIDGKPCREVLDHERSFSERIWVESMNHETVT